MDFNLPWEVKVYENNGVAHIMNCHEDLIVTIHYYLVGERYAEIAKMIIEKVNGNAESKNQ